MKAPGLSIQGTWRNIENIRVWLLHLLAAGALSYIGTICKINDSSGLSRLQPGFMMNYFVMVRVLDKVCKTQEKNFLEQHGDEDLSWLAFRLYGDPNSKRDFVAEAIIRYGRKSKGVC